MPPDNRQPWTVRGLRSGETLALGRRITPQPWVTPRPVVLEASEAEGAILRWRGDAWAHVDPPLNLLDRFVELADATDENILSFADTYGVVLLCQEHRLPIEHGRVLGARPDGDSLTCTLLGDPHPFTPSSWYRDEARRFQAILNVAAQLLVDKPGLEIDWDVVSPYYASSRGHVFAPGSWSGRPATNTDLLEEDRIMLSEILDSFIDVGGVRLRFSWNNERGRSYYLGCDRLWGYLSASLVVCVALSDGLAVCAGCGKAFQPRRRPNPNRRAFCDDGACKITARQRLGQRDHRERVRRP